MPDIEITQADRDAAAALIVARPIVENPDIIIHGGANDGGFVQAFARHRTEAIAPYRALVEAVGPILLFHQTGGHEGNGSDEALERALAALAKLETPEAPAQAEDEEDWGCEYCRNDGRLTERNTCPKCDAQYDERVEGGE